MLSRSVVFGLSGPIFWTRVLVLNTPFEPRDKIEIMSVYLYPASFSDKSVLSGLLLVMRLIITELAKTFIFCMKQVYC